MTLPSEVLTVLETLRGGGFDAYAVGGCVRDLLRGEAPKDWDVTTNARPEEIQKLFPEHVYENTFGTVGVKTGSDEPTRAIIEVTPYRIEGKYSDKRHPDEIRFAKTLREDLSRRDFTVNAMAMDKDGNIIDEFGGTKDLQNKILRTVGDPNQRFSEDALRILRAARFATVLNFAFDEATRAATTATAAWLEAISKERIRDEFLKIIESPRAYQGVLLLEELGLLKYIVPELREGISVTQNLHHIYTVWEHNALALQYAANQGYSLAVRLAALFHDIGKPRSKRGEGTYATFYGHEVIGARMAAGIAERLKFSGDLTDRLVKLVRYHMFFYNVGEVTESSVRRLIANVGKENVEDLLKLREADRIGSGRPKAVPYKLRHLKYMIEKVSKDPISVKMLKVDGHDVMNELKDGPGPKVGLVLNMLLAEVLDEPGLNVRERLISRIHELDKSTPQELAAALEKIQNAQQAEDQAIAEKHHVETN
ncbi:MAG TPA: HD domain-containing protein [Candidatus Paceibacterota bacterium]|nr:HD domain-containing protein [Candidatus Paceibacterota bacterium]